MLLEQQGQRSLGRRQRRQVAAVPEDAAARGGDEAGDGREQRALAGAGRADQRGGGAGLDREVGRQAPVALDDLERRQASASMRPPRSKAQKRK